MSRIGRKSVVILDNVRVTLQNTILNTNGPQGQLSLTIPNTLHIEIQDKYITLYKRYKNKKTNELYGLYRTLINNMITGVSKGFSKHLILQGIGYRAQMSGKQLILNVGYSHTIQITPPPNINIKNLNNTNLIISGPDKSLVGQIAAKIRAVRPPEPYKGKGIRYQQEIVKQKIGKSGK